MLTLKFDVTQNVISNRLLKTELKDLLRTLRGVIERYCDEDERSLTLLESEKNLPMSTVLEDILSNG